MFCLTDVARINPALAGVGPVLVWSGYVEDAPVPAVILFIGVILAGNYPLNRERHRQVQHQLGERRLRDGRGLDPRCGSPT
ncbi:MAG: hypothetical protein ACOC88_04570 [Candidatus Bipolaricaulota bacterium]